MIARRRLLTLSAAGAFLPRAALAAPPAYPVVRPGVRLAFPADHGAHPDFRTEWWYVTGWLRAGAEDLGFQVTFFRSRPAVDQANPSAFSPRQIIFAHAALSDPALRRLRHGQRIARAGFGLAEARTGDADLVLADWSFRRAPDGLFRTHVAGEGFALDLALQPTQPILLQGQGGYSRKGPRPEQASHYYSLPHLKVSGSIVRDGRRQPVTGEAWLDREWSSTLLDPQAVGWDWTGLNLDDGSALTAFVVRRRDGGALWAGGSFREPAGRTVELGPDQVRFQPSRWWTSPRTGARYPVQTVVQARLPSGPRAFPLQPLFDDQELDSSQGGGPVYWEGAARTPGGRGYLELTGYASPLAL